MVARIRTLNFLPEVFRTETNAQFLGATLDQLVDQPSTQRIQGYIGSKFGYGINAKDKYVTEPTKTRTDYQLDPGVVFTKTNTSIATDFVTYPGIIDALKLNDGITNNNDRLFNSQFYSWDPFVNLDMLINFNQYYWLPEGPPSVTVATDIVYNVQDYTVEDEPNAYLISSDINPSGSANPTITLIRGGTYTFSVNQNNGFWIQGKPGVTGFDPIQPNLQTREILGVSNNGANSGIVEFNVPYKNAQDEYNFPGNNLVDVVSNAPFDSIQGKLLSEVVDIDGVTALQGLTVMFYNTGVPNELGFVGQYYDVTTFDQGGGNPYVFPGSSIDDNNFEGGYYTDVSATFYTVTYEGDPSDPVIKLVPSSAIPTNQKITANFGTQWKARNFYRNVQGNINLIPYLSSLLDILYYQDASNPNKVGIIRLIDSNITNQINVLEILGKKNYTSPNGIVFTNGLKVTFDGDIFPESYKTGEYYVQGVGTAIELLNVQDLIVPEPFTEGVYVPYDTTPYDIGNFDVTLYIPVRQDYITIARNSIDKNAWSRSNRWFHIDVINATASYNNDPSIITTYATQGNKAKRPIIEFYPNLKLFDNCIVGKQPIDFFDVRTTDAFNQVAGQPNYYPDVEVYTEYTASIALAAAATSTTITIPAADVSAGTFQVGQYITDSAGVLPRNTQITSITGTSTLTITVSWVNATSFATTVNVSLIASDISNDNYSLYDGARIVFANDTNPSVKNKIYVVRFSSISGSTPVITLTEADDGAVLLNEGTFAFKGYYNQGKNFYYYFNNDPAVLENQWQLSQQKTIINQAPYFDVFDSDGVSFGDKTVYTGSSFIGNKLFSYGIGSGINDIVLGFPLRYSSVNNVGDISFDVPLNSATFNYVRGSSPITQKVNTGYVYNYKNLYDAPIRNLGWQTAVAESRQYQIFSFNYLANSGNIKYTCDIAASTNTVWPNIQVYVNNVIQPKDSYTYVINPTSTVITFTVPEPELDTIVEVAILSDQVSATAYYQVPINLQNNPFNQDITTANVGDIRGQYQSIFYNNPNTAGTVFGANNYRDLGNLVPWGNKIIQNSASLVLPGTFLRKPGVNLCDALQFNSNQYIIYKTLLVDTVNNTEFTSYQTAATMLDDALDQMTASKVESASFFWSDMLPGKSTFVTNTYTFANSLDVSRYPLSRIYDFTTANYYGVLVYLTRTVNNFTTVTQLIKGVDYTVSSTSPSLTVETDLLPGDIITVKEYNQTYGSYVPNTPTKLGLYPSFIPGVVLDDNYTNPTYFIRGHDGSYTKLYGDYVNGNLVDFRDQVLLEFEKRIYNNLKLDNLIPIRDYDVVPGFFRTTDYSYDEFLQIYSVYFLNWVGQNRVEYKEHIGYTPINEFSFNYSQSGNRINNKQILQGYWRGVYQYFYDTSTPDTTPWEMLGYTDQPTWWQTRYGPAPYTSDNLVLWGDLAAGIDWNNGYPVVVEQFVRPELLQVIPVDSQGNLLSPFDSLVGNYQELTFRNNWKVGDVAPTEFAYRRSSTWPFDLMKILSLTKPAEFYNLGVDVDNYKYNQEFNQFLVNNRSHLVISDIEIYGNGNAKTSYINWIIDYEKQVGIDSTQTTTDLLDNLDVRLIYRVAGFTDKDLINFYVEKGTPNSRNASLLIPSESLNVLLYDNVPFNQLIYSGVIVQNVGTGWKVYGNSQNKAYFTVSKPKINGNYQLVTVTGESVQVAVDYFENSEVIVPYGTEFVSKQDLSQFLASYGNYLETEGVLFDQIVSGTEVNWKQMIAEYLYWTQSGWGLSSLLNLNPAAELLTINKDSYIVQPLTLQRQNFVLNQNLYPIQSVDLSVVRDETLFSAKPLNEGDSIAYGQFNITNFEHGIVFDNVTLFNDVIYNLITGLRQNRIFTRGTKTADWNGTIDSQGFILNQDNIQEWNNITKYTKGSIVKYKNKYWIALKVLEPSMIFESEYWKETDYNEIQKGLLPNPSTRSFESTLYYDTNQPNLSKDADLLSWSLIGYRPRDYLALADLTDITQVNVYKNLIKEKGTRIATENFKGIQLPQGGIDYEVYENWAIKTGEFGGVLNNNFVDFKLNESQLTGNPSTVGLTNGVFTEGVQQEVPLYTVFNYGRPITDPNVLPVLPANTPNKTFPDAGYVNFNDVTTYGYYYNDLNSAQTPLNSLYVGEYVWIADYQGTWQIYTPISNGTLVQVVNNLNDTVTLEFAEPHGLRQFQTIAIINFDDSVNGYRVVTSVTDNYRVVISLALPSALLRLTGEGIVFRFQSQRLTQPSEVINLPLLNTEFVKNKVWVDTDTTGSWAVYRKSLNYQYTKEFLKTNSFKFGSAVATTSDLGYLISDSQLGEVYRYLFNPVFNRYDLVQILSGSTSYGSSIGYSGNMFAISQPTGATLADRKVEIYQLVVSVTQNELVPLQTTGLGNAIQAPTGVTNWGSKTELSGDGNWLYISAYEQNIVYVYRKSQVTGLYEYSTTITIPNLVSGDNFSYSVATNYYGNTITIGAPGIDTGVTNNTGKSFIFERVVQNIEVQFTSQVGVPQTFNLAFTPATRSITATNIASNVITLANVTGISKNMPVIFTGTVFGGVQANKVYYIQDNPSGNTIKLSLTRNGSVLPLSNSSGTMNAVVQTEPLYVSVNGTLINDNNYAITNSTLNVYQSLNAGDIVNVSGSTFVLIQQFTATGGITIGQQYGYSADLDIYGNELLIGSPYQISTQNKEGAIYRYTDGGGKYGIISGSIDCQITSPTTILLNGYAVQIPVGNAAVVANAIASAGITNITATAVDNKLIISLVNTDLASVTDKLDICVLNGNVLYELGISKYTQTQVIVDPHPAGRTQFGAVIKFNDNGSFVTSAPASARYSLTTFDSTDDENYKNDTVFDNNTTQYTDTFTNAGAVYMFDYLGNYNENLTNVGNFVYAQSVNALNIDYGAQPYYGTAIDFNDNTVIIGTPNFRPGINNGQAIVYSNTTGIQDWSVYRQSQVQVDIASIQNAQLYSASTNNTLINLDYFDPLQGKLLGVVAQNLDVISNIDPATYNSPDNTDSSGASIWGAKNVGQLWFDTSTTKFVNYHQDNDVVYNSRYWGQVFPGSQVAIYSWITSNVTPDLYTGPGTPYNLTNYSIEYVLNATGAIVPVYFYWVRNTNIIFNQLGKTLSDTICESYISAPKSSGIAYFSPLQSNVMGLYNCGEYINDNDTVMHIGFATGTNDDVSHSSYTLIRENYPDDFLPGLPGVGGVTRPESLYDRMLDSLSGVDESGAVVPDPYLPKPVQSGILVRPRQSFFYNRFGGLKNYLTLANELLKQIPFVESATDILFLFKQGEINPSTGLPFYDTEDYWEYSNWWAEGYNDNTRSAMMVDFYYQLTEINAQNGLIVTVRQNGAGLQETYRYDGTTSTWVRIGLQNGTIQFKSSLWDYETARLGFGDNFFDTTPFDTYPSEETRNIVRFLNEDSPDDLFAFRNKGLILLFNYIVSETIESQNYLPWLNKTSFIDVAHKIRELLPLEVFQSDNQQFLEGYINEVKPYHVVIKDFLFKYTGSDLWVGTITDFDLPAQYNKSIEQFITPELVFENQSGFNEFLPTDSIWSNSAYNEWFNNYGVSITGVNNYPITILASYLTLSSNSLVVDNVYGFPINGVIKIYDANDPETDLSKKSYELIAYSSVDREYSTLKGLTRGVNDTPVTTHLPGQQIYIDLPAVLVLDGGRGYANPPKVTAYIDTSLYPAPRREAILSPVMNIDSLLRVDVIDPGDGYVVLPEIRIEPSAIVTFSNDDVNLINNTISIQNQILKTGDLVKYRITGLTTSTYLVGTNGVGGLKDNQYYYVNVLESTPSYVVALYTSYANALNDRDRVVFLDAGTSADNKLEISARASCVTNATPVRENIITLRYDRTTYNSQVTEWTPNNFYGSFYAGSLLNSERVASSSITIAPPEFEFTPPIDSVLASGDGTPFEIQNITNNQVINWSSLVRNITSINVSSNEITLTPPSSTQPNASGSTIGFYVGMPVKFVGSVSGNIVAQTTYYITEIVSETKFKINVSMAGTSIGAGGLTMYVGEVTNKGVVTIQYPGILNATATEKNTNYITIPLIASGQGGTNGFYTGIPLFFTGEVFGGIVENETYYVTAVVDSETFTISTNESPTIVVVESTENIGDYAVLSSIEDLEVNTPVIVNDMYISGSLVTNFGGITSGVVYYIASIDYSTKKVTLSTAVNSDPIQLTDCNTTLFGPNTYATLISQADAVQLQDATGNMTCNIGLPISPGQINGQKFTFYTTSTEFTNSGAGYTGTNSNLITRDTVATTSNGNYLYLEFLTGGTTEMYVNMPFRLADSIGGLTAGVTYFVKSIGTVTTTVTSSNAGTDEYTCASTAGFYVGMPISFTGAVFGGIEELVTYYIDSVVSVTNFTIRETPIGSTFNLSGANGSMTLTGDNPFITLTIDPPSGPQSIASLNDSGTYVNSGYFVIGDQYQIAKVGTTDFTLIGAPSNTLGTVFTATSAGLITAGSFVVGLHYTIVTVGTTDFTLIGAINNNIGTTFVATGSGSGTGTASQGTGVAISYPYSTALTQYPTATPKFIISYALGGYSVKLNQKTAGNFVISNTYTITSVGTTDFTLIGASANSVGITFVATGVGTGTGMASEAGSGFALNNKITIPGSSVGGTTGVNDITITVSSINNVGAISTTSISGTPPGPTNQYYLKVISATELEVYSNPLMTVPVSGITLDALLYKGIKTTNVTAINSSGNITVNNFTNFSVDDPVVFTGNIVGNIILGQTYYILTKYLEPVTLNNIVTISETIRGSTFNPGTSTGLNFVMGKKGDNALLPEPFYFNQSIVRYNNNLYECIISNNDTEFVFGKWELLDSGSRKLNALDRIIGYYNPTINMPGRDLTQLVAGVTYPGSSYTDNPFPPDEEFIYDTFLQDQPFYPTDIDNVAVVYDGVKFIAGSNTPEYSAAIISTLGDDWSINKIANNPVNVTDISFANGLYVMTTSNPATPIYISQNGIIWISSGGLYTTYGTAPYDSTAFDVTSLSVNSTSLNASDYNNGKWVAVGENIVLSTDNYGWNQVYSLPYTGYLTDVKYINIPIYQDWLAIGNWNVSGVDQTVLLVSSDAITWTQINPSITTTITNAYLNALAPGNGLIIYVADNGRIFTTTNNISFTEQTSGVSDNLNDVIYVDGVYIVVGDNGTILTSNNGITWNIDVSGTTEHLNGVTSDGAGKYLVVGNNNTILTSTSTGINKTWTPSNVYLQTDTVYNVKGESFTTGYGPEELVPGVVTDNLTMIVNTRPGTNWPVGQYGHTGFTVIFTEITPTYPQTNYSFLNIVQNPAFMALYDIDPSTGLSTRIYESFDYSVNWVLKTITLNTTLAPNHTLGIELYEVGNGDQLQRSNSQTVPFIDNPNTGFIEIPLNCNYSANMSNGNGVIRPGTEPQQIECIETESSTNTITCVDVSNFALNEPIVFQGAVFGGIVVDQIYYVKTISYITNKITIALPPLVGGIAGPTFALTDATGSMQAIIQEGTGIVWADPIVIHNGTKLVFGETSVVTETKSATNSIVVNTRLTFDINDPIVFSDYIFGGLTPHTTYYINGFIDSNEFTVSATLGGSTVTLTDATGFASCVTNDYAIAEADVGITAKLVFANNYTQANDFITFAVFGETEPIQYSYSIPETQLYQSTGGETQLYLTNYIGGDNPENAVVELNGLRLTNVSDYTIDLATQTIYLTSSLTAGDLLAITTYNSTERQYLHTTLGGTYSGSQSITLSINATTHLSGFDEEVTAGVFLTGTTYQILSIGTTDFTLIGATQVTAGSFVPGVSYIINSVGTTDFTLIGAASNAVGVTFTATGVGSGTGTAIESVFTATGAGTGTGTAGVGYGGGVNYNAGSFIIGQQYTISSFNDGATPTPGPNTDFSLIGAGNATVTGSIATTINPGVNGGVLTITAVSSGTVLLGSALSGTGIVPGTKVISQLSGTTGGIGTYKVNISQTTLSTSITTDGTIIGVTFTATGVGTGSGSATQVGGNTYSPSPDYLTLATGTTANLVPNMPIIFTSVFGGVITANTTYYISSIIDSTKFSISLTPNGFPLQLTTATGLVSAFINPPRVSNITAIDNNITPPLAVTIVTDTTVTSDKITCASTAGFIAGQPVLFKVGATTGGSFVNGKTYKITSIGTTDFTLIGAASNTVGITFTATGSGTGTGTGSLISFGGLSTMGTVYWIKGVNTGYFTIGSVYTITQLGNTDFTLLGASSNTVGITFVATAPGTLGETGQALGATEFSVSATQGGSNFVLTTDSGALYAYVGGNPAVTITTGVPHNLIENDVVRIDDVVGSVQLNNNTYYAKIISGTQIALYFTPYEPENYQINDPVTVVSSYVSGGYVWLDKQFTLINATAIQTFATTNTIEVNDVSTLVIDTPVYFSGEVFGNIVEGAKYYVKSIDVGTKKITVSQTYQGEELTLSNDTGSMGVSMWEQSNVDRLWVTVNGYHVPSTSLYVNPNNNLSILTTIVPGDVVIITNMIPTATPDELTYFNNVNKYYIPTVYRATTLSTTWLTQPLENTDTVIHVEDVSKITTNVIQNETATVVSGLCSIGLDADKRIISQVIVVNNTTSTTLSSSSYSINVVNTAPILEITGQVSNGDSLTITIILGNLIYVAGEQIKFSTVNFVNNTLSGLQRGSNGTGERNYIPAYEKVYSILSTNQLPNVNYKLTWNSNNYNPVLGDPLQISSTTAATFLNSEF